MSARENVIHKKKIVNDERTNCVLCITQHLFNDTRFVRREHITIFTIHKKEND